MPEGCTDVPTAALLRNLTEIALNTAPSGDPLKVADFRKINVVIESLSRPAEKIGLTEERLRTRVELRLRSLNFDVVSTVADPEKGGFLNVRVTVFGHAYSGFIAFNRDVYFREDEEVKWTHASVWGTGSTGQHGDDPGYILDSVEGHLERFLNAYLKANQD